MIDPGWVLNPSTWLLVGAVCLLLEIFFRWLLFLALGLSGAVIAALVWRFADWFATAGSPVLTTSLAFMLVGMLLWLPLLFVIRGRGRSKF
ncbi:MAG: hypothetical protein AAFX92_11225 [Pseudomonadota bacterium]